MFNEYRVLVSEDDKFSGTREWWWLYNNMHNATGLYAFKLLKGKLGIFSTVKKHHRKLRGFSSSAKVEAIKCCARIKKNRHTMWWFLPIITLKYLKYSLKQLNFLFSFSYILIFLLYQFVKYFFFLLSKLYLFMCSFTRN